MIIHETHIRAVAKKGDAREHRDERKRFRVPQVCIIELNPPRLTLPEVGYPAVVRIACRAAKSSSDKSRTRLKARKSAKRDNMTRRSSVYMVVRVKEGIINPRIKLSRWERYSDPLGVSIDLLRRIIITR